MGKFEDVNNTDGPTKEIGQIDQPISRDKGIEGDELEITKYVDVLTEFIRGTKTPITIGVQGEWGSGKTSLLNMIHNELEQPREGKARFSQIWINAWEHSLRRDAPETLLRIVQDICEQVMKYSCDLDTEKAEVLQEARKKGAENFKFNDKDFNVEEEEAKHKLASAVKVRKNIFKWGKTLTKVAVAAVPGIDGKSAYSALEDECNESNTDDGIRELRLSLNELLDCKDGKLMKYVVYIDDLDRINPTHAVDVLELLKNIFDLKNCIFVLAIDYQVVVKGLKDKFGSKEEGNEWEFRSFFDKIIQLPFFMPTEKYAVGNYVKKKLKEVDFTIPDDDTEAEENESVCDRVIKNTITSNPRSIIRLVNSVKLIEMIHQHDNAEQLDDQHRLLLFALVSIQIAYPELYALLQDKPNFIDWDQSLVTEYYVKNNIKPDEEQIESDLKRMDKMVEFDEPWEKNLYRICHAKPRYKARSTNASRILNIIRNDIISNLVIKDEMSKVLQLTAVTSVISSDSIFTTAPTVLAPERTKQKNIKALKQGSEQLWERICEIVSEKEAGTEIEQKLFDYLKLLSTTTTSQSNTYQRSRTKSGIPVNFVLSYSKSKPKSILHFKIPRRDSSEPDITEEHRLEWFRLLEIHKDEMERVLQDKLEDAKLKWTTLKVELEHPDINKFYSNFNTQKTEYIDQTPEPLIVPQKEVADELGQCFARFLGPFESAIAKGIQLLPEQDWLEPGLTYDQWLKRQP